MRDAAGQLADGVHLLDLPQPRLRLLLFGQIAADEEVPPHRFRPRPHPCQRHRLAVLANVTGLEVAHLPAVPRRAHFLAGGIEVVGVDEFDRTVPDHLFGPITQDRHRTRRDLNEISPRVRHQDEILRGLEDTAPLLDLLVERLLRSFGFGDIARDLGRSDNLSRDGPDRRYGKRHMYLGAILVHP